MNATERPKYIPRTGETELHLMGNLLERNASAPFYATEKLDGFSFSFGWVDGRLVAATRDRLVEPSEDSVFGEFVRTFGIHMLPYGYIFQGELVGPGIRGNRYGLDKLKFYVFDVLKDGVRLDYAEAKQVCDEWKLATVPLIFVSLVVSREVCLIHCGGPSALNPSVQREGVVVRTMTETCDDYQGRVSFKVFNWAYPWHH